MNESSKYSFDTEVVLKLKQEDKKMLQQVYLSNFSSIEKLVTTNSGSTKDAEDIYQEAFIVFLDKINDPNFTLTCKIKTFLYSISRNLWLKELRKKSTGRVSSIEDHHEYIADLASYIEEEDIQDDRERMVMGALNKMGDPCKRLLYLYYFNNKSMLEIATLMQYKSAKATRNQSYKCKERLRKLFQ